KRVRQAKELMWTVFAAEKTASSDSSPLATLVGSGMSRATVMRQTASSHAARTSQECQLMLALPRSLTKENGGVLQVAAVRGRGRWTIAGPAHPVSRRLRDGDRIGEFRVIHAPGHTPGHVIYFRDRDRVAISGDVLAHRHMISGKIHLIEPPRIFSADKMQNRR